MESINRGFVFIAQVWSLARAHPTLLKASGRGLVAGLLLTLAFWTPAAAILVFLKLQPLAGLLVGLLGAIWLISLPIISYIFASAAIPGLAAVLSGEAPDELAGRQVLSRWSDLLGLAAATMPGVLLRNRGEGIFRAPWNAAPGLVRPALLLENLEFKAALARTSEILRANRLLMAPGQIGVAAAGLLINLLSWLTGGALALLAGKGIAHQISGNAGLVVGLACGVLLFALIALLSLAVTSFSTAAYQACLFLWTRQVEESQTGATTIQPNPPAPLFKALSGASSLSAPIFSD